MPLTEAPPFSRARGLFLAWRIRTYMARPGVVPARCRAQDRSRIARLARVDTQKCAAPRRLTASAAAHAVCDRELARE